MNHYLRLGKRWLREKSTVIIIHLQTCCSSPNTSRACNKVYQQEFAKKGGAGMGGDGRGKLIYREAHKHRLQSLSKDDGNVNENGKKELKVSKIGKTTTLHVHYVHFFAVTARLRRENA